MPHHRCFRLLACALAALLLTACAGQMAFREGRDLVAKDKVEAGLLKFQEAVSADPLNPEYRAAWLQARDRNSTRLLDQADRKFSDGKIDLALQDYRRVLSFDPANERALAGLRQIESDARLAKRMEEANAAFERKDYEVARQKVTGILTERPGHEPARLLQNKITELTLAPPAESGLSAAFKTPISIEFRDAAIKQVFEVISHRSGLNFLFDKDVKTDQRTSIFLKNSTVEAAIYFMLVTNQLEQQVMDGNTILIYPNVPAKLKEYQEMTVKTFFIANGEAKIIANTLKTILKSRDVIVDEKLNLVIVRDSPEAIKLASRLIALQDVPEPEVMLEVEILEVKRSRILELGVEWPGSLTFAPLQTVAGPLTINEIRGLNRDSIGVAGVSATIKANKTDGDSNTLANPRIRVRNKEKAKVVIGDKVPTITTTISPGAGGFASESVNYVDVGLTLNVEPTIYLNDEVAIRISLEVSNLLDTITTKSGTTGYRIGTRSATTMLQLKDGENQVLAGLIKNEDTSSGNKVPGFGSLPILGRLFGSTRDSNDKTEVVLSITPHLVRNIQRPPASSSEFSAGTESSFRRRPDMSVRAAAGKAGAVQNGPVQFAPGQNVPTPVQNETVQFAPGQNVPTPVQPGAAVTPVPAPQTSPVPKQ